MKNKVCLKMDEIAGSLDYSNDDSVSRHDIQSLCLATIVDYAIPVHGQKRIFFTGMFTGAYGSINFNDIREAEGRPIRVVDLRTLLRPLSNGLLALYEEKMARIDDAMETRISAIAKHVQMQLLSITGEGNVTLLKDAVTGRLFGIHSNRLVCVYPLAMSLAVSQGVPEGFNRLSLVAGEKLYNAIFDLCSGSHTTAPPAVISEKITIGADPEFALYEAGPNGEDRDYKKQVTAAMYFGGTNTAGEVGTDGCSAIFEIRPKPAETAEQFTSNVEGCIERLADKLMDGTDEDTGLPNAYFLEAGGGFKYSLGGHLHIGNATLRKHQDVLQEPLGKLYDHFLYYPIRERMPGAARSWSELTPFKKCRILDEAGRPDMMVMESLEGVLKSVKEHVITRGTRAAGYDESSSFRLKEYGFEYRSLPSFVANKEFTRLVASMMLSITRVFLKKLADKVSIEFSLPPTEQDYLQFISADEFKLFMHYINGDKRDLFLTDVIKGWGFNNVSARPFRIMTTNAICDEAKSALDKSLNESGYQDRIAGLHLKIKIFYWYSQLDGNDFFVVVNPRGNRKFAGYSNDSMTLDQLRDAASCKPNKNTIVIGVDTRAPRVDADTMLNLIKNAVVEYYKLLDGRDVSKEMLLGTKKNTKAYGKIKTVVPIVATIKEMERREGITSDSEEEEE